MTQWLAIAVYRCEVNGEPNESLDFRVQYFDLANSIQVETTIRNTPPSSYLNSEGETVSWPLSRILAIEELLSHEHGDELIGFIAQSSEIPTWTIPSA